MLKKQPTASAIRAANRNAVGGARKRCRKGKNCSATCIDAGKGCLVGLPEPVSQATTKVRNMLQQRMQGKMPAPPKIRAESLQRPNPTPTPETASTTPQAVKKEGVYAPRTDTGPTGVKSDFQKSEAIPKNPFEPEKIQKLLDKVRSGKKVKQFGKTVTEEELDRKLKQSEKNTEFIKKLESNLPKDYKVTVYGGGLVSIEKTTKAGDKVAMTFSGRNIRFEVNGQMDAGGVTNRTAQMEVAGAVRSAYDAITKSLSPGAIISTVAYTDDGKGAARQRVYERIGFSKAKPGETIYAVKLKDGSMAPLSEKDPQEALIRQYNDENSMWFAERGSTYYQKDGWEQDKMWHIAIFGTP